MGGRTGLSSGSPEEWSPGIPAPSPGQVAVPQRPSHRTRREGARSSRRGLQRSGPRRSLPPLRGRSGTNRDITVGPSCELGGDELLPLLGGCLGRAGDGSLVKRRRAHSPPVAGGGDRDGGWDLAVSAAPDGGRKRPSAPCTVPRRPSRRTRREVVRPFHRGLRRSGHRGSLPPLRGRSPYHGGHHVGPGGRSYGPFTGVSGGVVTAAGDTVAGDTAVGDASAGDTSAGDTAGSLLAILGGGG